MLVKSYTVYIEEHDYFEHFGAPNGSEVKHFDSLTEAFRYYKDSKSKDVCWYGDHTRKTHKPKAMWEYRDVPQKKHGKVLGEKKAQYKQWERKSLLGGKTIGASIPNDVRDIETKPVVEEQYVFDKGDIDF